MDATTARVSANTAAHVNQWIKQRTEENVARYAGAGAGAIDLRLEELDREWDIERFVLTAAPTGILVGLTLGATVNRRLLVLPAAIAAFLLLHATQGWAPPIPVLRRLGFRTAGEIDEERYALKALRGDFRDLALHTGRHDIEDVRQALDAARS